MLPDGYKRYHRVSYQCGIDTIPPEHQELSCATGVSLKSVIAVHLH
jgi:hypothetical protein